VNQSGSGLTGLTLLDHVELPAHRGEGGFDHAAIDRGRGRLYVAHTANDALDVIDVKAGRYVASIEGLKGVAGALVHESEDLLFTSNRGENMIAIMSPSRDESMMKVVVGHRPNGLAYDPDRGVLLCANVGDPGGGHPPSVTLVDVRGGRPLATIPMPGRTRWAVFDPDQGLFFINIADPPRIAVVEAGNPVLAVRYLDVPARGPHGLELDPSGHRLLCACDGGDLVSLDSRSGEVLGTLKLTGAPDVVFLNQSLAHLYVAIGDPGVIDVVDIDAWKTIEAVPTERGAHTLAHDENSNRVYAFLPQTHRAAVFQDGA
jgi:DNA-binding beta-propeller fold protein YncE